MPQEALVTKRFRPAPRQRAARVEIELRTMLELENCKKSKKDQNKSNRTAAGTSFNLDKREVPKFNRLNDAFKIDAVFGADVQPF